MKRYNKLFEQIISWQNFRLAFLKASKGKSRSSEVILFTMKLDENLEGLRRGIANQTYSIGEYRQFKIYDPKERIISVAPFKDRVIHHAIINILEPIFEKQFVFHTYACRKGKGTHAAARYVFKKARSNNFFLKLDVKKYFDSIDHIELKRQLTRIIKDKRCLVLLFKIIDSYYFQKNKGLPIGNLTSQFFANLYLSSLDHFILEQLKPACYARYMDDMIILADSVQELKADFHAIQMYITQKLDLTLKQEIYGKVSKGIPFLGWKITNNSITVLLKTRKRMKKKLKEIQHDFLSGKITEIKAAERNDCVFNSRIG